MQLVGQRDDLGDRELDDTAGVGERGVEGSDPVARRGGEVDLVRLDAERADRQQVRSGLKHGLGDVGGGTDPEHVDADDGVGQLLLGQRAGPGLDLPPAVLQQTKPVRMDVFHEQSTGGPPSWNRACSCVTVTPTAPPSTCGC